MIFAVFKYYAIIRDIYFKTKIKMQENEQEKISMLENHSSILLIAKNVASFGTKLYIQILITTENNI